jgi:hypothetical protein
MLASIHRPRLQISSSTKDVTSLFETRVLCAGQGKYEKIQVFVGSFPCHQAVDLIAIDKRHTNTPTSRHPLILLWTNTMLCPVQSSACRDGWVGVLRCSTGVYSIYAREQIAQKMNCHPTNHPTIPPVLHQYTDRRRLIIHRLRIPR